MSSAQGPLKILLQSQAGQYAFIGAGIYGFFPEQVKAFLGPLLKRALAVVDTPTSRGGIGPQNAFPSNIIIHSNPSGKEGPSQSASTTVTTVIVGAGACWAAYMVVTNFECIPDFVKEMLPVTRRFFGQTSKKLSHGIICVKDIIEEQILGLHKKQEDLGRNQEVTHDEVLVVKADVNGARADLSYLRSLSDSHSKSMDASRRLQSHSTRGVNLLVRAVATFLPDESTFLGELDQYIKDGNGFVDGVNVNNPEKRFPSIKSDHKPALGL
mmetsp:Transcript_16369/g.24990  ORF Transcript_16369/g.24990 Transcript_16369/m.24990 type:complete len:269 (-) Transcript_16369:411-1217(-)